MEFLVVTLGKDAVTYLAIVLGFMIYNAIKVGFKGSNNKLYDYLWCVLWPIILFNTLGYILRLLTIGVDFLLGTAYTHIVERKK